MGAVMDYISDLKAGEGCMASFFKEKNRCSVQKTNISNIFLRNHSSVCVFLRELA